MKCAPDLQSVSFEMLILYQLYLDEPSRTRASYIQWLFYFTGKVVSESTISSFFNKCFLSCVAALLGIVLRGKMMQKDEKRSVL